VFNEAHWPLTMQRFMWDVYDDVAAGETDTVVQGWDWWRIWDNFANYPTGRLVNQTDEPWKDDGSNAVDDGETRASGAYASNFLNGYSIGIGGVRTINCQPF
jgi:hypothetical protein